MKTRKRHRHKSKKHKTKGIADRKHHHHKKTIRHYMRELIKVPNSTPIKIRKISSKINNALKKGSYSPTINQQLITLKSIARQDLLDCNMEQAFKLKEPLQIGVKGKCYYYYKPEARQFLLHNLAANRHIDSNNIIPPIQSQSNCWFNTMFVTFFVSDKGRKFFHFLRQLMIDGKQQDGTAIPNKLRDAFALLNFGIDACLTGNEFVLPNQTP